MHSRISAVAVLTLLLPLAACNNTQNIQVCPAAGILADTAMRTVMRPGAPADPSGELYSVRLTGAKTDCVLVKETNETDSTVDLTFHASRAPNADGASYTVPYYVAGTQAARVLIKKNYTADFRFAPGAQTADFTVHVDSVRIVQETGLYAGSYQITAGIQLTDAERAYNSKRDRYAP